jgi:hypothetical protein
MLDIRQGRLPPSSASPGSAVSGGWRLPGATLVYLALPPLIFLGTWIKLLYGLPAAVLLIVGVASALRQLQSERPALGVASLSSGDLLRAGLPAIVLGLLSGAGGIGFQDSDWLKHNALLADLTSAPWPVVYDGESGPLLLTYYVAWYLPAALAGKLAGWPAANWTLAFYTTAGLCLAGLWAIRLTGVRRWWVVALFLAFSGMDVVGLTLRELKAALGGGALDGPEGSWSHIEWWAGLGAVQYSGMTTLMMWVPNQALAGWLLTPLVAASAAARRLAATGLLYLALSVLWAPFVTLGLLPFIVILGLAEGLRGMPRNACTTANLAGVILGLITTIYLAARFSPYQLPADVAALYTAGFGVRGDLGFILVRYPLFVVVEFLLLHALLYGWLALHPAPERGLVLRLLLVASATLLALPFIKYGFNNDLVMRASIPALFVTVLVTIMVLADRSGAVVLRAAILVVLALGSVTTVIEIQRHVRAIYLRGSLVAIPAREEVPGLIGVQRQRYAHAYNFLGQYVGSTTSPFMQHLAPTASGPPAAAEAR